jgi:hypothetical protein
MAAISVFKKVRHSVFKPFGMPVCQNGERRRFATSPCGTPDVDTIRWTNTSADANRGVHRKTKPASRPTIRRAARADGRIARTYALVTSESTEPRVLRMTQVT